MDGAGRLARSLRSLRPQADLVKAAAKGALILLRERLALLHERLAPLQERLAEMKRARAKRLTEREKNPHRLIARLERHIPQRVGVTATVVMLLGSAGLGVVKGGHVEQVTTALSDTR